MRAALVVGPATLVLKDLLAPVLSILGLVASTINVNRRTAPLANQA